MLGEDDELMLTCVWQLLFTETEKLLEKWKHPDPYRPPSAPGGSKFERNMPPPDLPPPSREDVKRL